MKYDTRIISVLLHIARNFGEHIFVGKNMLYLACKS